VLLEGGPSLLSQGLAITPRVFNSLEEETGRGLTQLCLLLPTQESMSNSGEFLPLNISSL